MQAPRLFATQKFLIVARARRAAAKIVCTSRISRFGARGESYWRSGAVDTVPASAVTKTLYLVFYDD